MSQDDDMSLRVALSLSLKEAHSKGHRQNYGNNIDTKDDYLIAKLLQEGINDESKNNNADGDYKLALLLQESENNESKMPSQRTGIVSNANNNHFSIQTDADQFSNSIFNIPSNTCYNCRKLIGHEGYFTALGVKYHSRCFICDGCNLPINGRFVPKLVPVSGSNNNNNNNSFNNTRTNRIINYSNNSISSVHAVPYHAECIRELYTPVCGVCNDKLQGE